MVGWSVLLRSRVFDLAESAGDGLLVLDAVAIAIQVAACSRVGAALLGLRRFIVVDAGVDDEYFTCRSTHDLLCGRPEQYPFPTRATAGGDDDELDFFFFSEAHDLVRRAAQAYVYVCGFDRILLGDLAQKLFGPADDGVGIHVAPQHAR